MPEYITKEGRFLDIVDYYMYDTRINPDDYCDGTLRKTFLARIFSGRNSVTSQDVRMETKFKDLGFDDYEKLIALRRKDGTWDVIKRRDDRRYASPSIVDYEYYDLEQTSLTKAEAEKALAGFERPYLEERQAEATAKRNWEGKRL